MRVSVNKDGSIAIADFSPVQAYKIAVKLEQDGIVFYEDLLKRVQDKGVRGDIEFLVGQEKEHLRTFEGLLGKTKEAVGDSFEEDDIVNDMDTHIFEAAVGPEKAKAVEHRHSALEEAMNMERRSIVFYEGCLAHSKEKTFTTILAEEKKHLAKFAELLRTKCIQSGKGCLL